MAQQTFNRKNIYKDFDVSFSFNPLTGDIGSKTDTNAINQSIRNLINTNFYERPFNPTFGCNIRSLLFEPADVITILDIKSAINDSISNHEPRVSLIDIFIQDNSEVNAYNITIVYNIISDNTVAEFSTVLKRLR